MAQGWCIRGDVVTGPHQVTRRAIFYNTEPQVTYHSNSSDQAYWGYAYTSFDGAESFADGSYTIFQCNQSDCQLSSSYDCLNGTCVNSTQYSTPGLYNSLSDCQAVCANGGACASGKKCVDPTNFCPDGKVCIDKGEFAEAEALLAKINNEVC